MDLTTILGVRLFGVLIFLMTCNTTSATGLRISRPPKNETVLKGVRLEMHCKARGQLPIKVKWYHNGREMIPETSNYNIARQSGTLRFFKVMVVDRGRYHCKASQPALGTQVESETVHLTVHAPVEITNIFNSKRVEPVGKLIRLQCEAAGIPLPRVQWRINGTSITKPNKELSISFKTKETSYATVISILKVRVTYDAVIECEANNEPVGIGLRVKTSQTKVKVIKVPEQGRTKGVCGVYNGTICAKTLAGRRVFYNNSLNDPRNDPEAIVRALWKEMLETGLFDQYCQEPAEKLMCHYAFRDCEEKNGEVVYKPICRESCLAVKDLFCYEQWTTIDENKKKDIFFKERGYFRLPNCSLLPSKFKGSCTMANLFEREPHEVTSDCYVGSGQWYNGTVNMTKSGATCQHWSMNSPQKHQRPPEIFVSLENSENYCRNPGSEEAQPWCYTMDKFKRWEFCDIPKCVRYENRTSSLDNLKEEPKFTFLAIFIITIVSSVGILVLALIVGLCFNMLIQNHHIKYNATPQEDLDIDIEKLPPNMSYHLMKEKNRLNPKLESLEYPRNDIIYIRDIGQGAFGRVFKAKVPNLLENEDCTLVGVKMLKEDASEDLQADFEREASLMAEFSHPNIVKLLGVCAIGKPMCLLFEYMSKGDLNEFLRLCSPEHFITQSRSLTDCQEMANLDTADQLYISTQIAAGMVYLAQKGYVHRDLATRNCLVSENLIVKISDFGLARSVHSVDYYKGSDNDAIPIRWMPLEAILYNKFTVESDVWSFGVVLWEIFSFALQPYYGMTHEEVVKYVKDGKILAQPESTPVPVYELIKNCWNKKPSSRPSFQSLHKSVCSFYEECSKKKNLKVSV
ncbi:tyrosine-protein kinase transmembrane receptor Ror2-like [Haliotis cracherodii]|uniref:tyrosine-protein kinase transmembrane receptor Ror2-like n=1 Tax=Haliotis cracherodii TaxID=6455 RepID=UPI0039E951FC